MIFMGADKRVVLIVKPPFGYVTLQTFPLTSIDVLIPFFVNSKGILVRKNCLHNLSFI